MPNGDTITKEPNSKDHNEQNRQNVSYKIRHAQKTRKGYGPIQDSHVAASEASDKNRHGARQRTTQNNGSIANQVANVSRNSSLLTFYPAYTFCSSPTYLKWVNLTACDVHRNLEIREGFSHSWLSSGFKHGRDSPQLVFYLNHPIQFVQVVGVVVNFEEYFEWFWLFTIDDSSGSTVDVICPKPEKKKPAQVESAAAEDADEKAQREEILTLSNQVASSVQIGAILQVKGTITLFQRNKPAETLKSLSTNHHPPKQEEPTRQITLQRLSVVHDTNQELNLIAARTKFYKEVLSKPWTLTQKEQHKLHLKALGEVEHERKRAKRRVDKKRKLEENEQRDAEQIQREYEAEEGQREEEAHRARQAGEQLNARKRAMHERSRATMATEAQGPTIQTDPRHVAPAIQPSNPAAKKKERKEQKGAPVAQFNVTHGAAIPRHEKPPSGRDASKDDDEKMALLRAAFGS